jgi:hypothetical protein
MPEKVFFGFEFNLCSFLELFCDDFIALFEEERITFGEQ